MTKLDNIAMDIDPQRGYFYWHFSNRSVAKTETVKEHRGILVNVDFDSNGDICGIEILRPPLPGYYRFE